MKMTNMTYSKTLRTLLSLLMLTVLIVTFFCVTASATPPIDDGENGVQWIYINADHTKLDGDGVTYEQVALPADCDIIFTTGTRYVYMNAPRGYGTNEGAYGAVYAAEKGGYLVYVDDYYKGVTAYCRTDKVATLQGYFNGTEGSFVLRQPWYETGEYDTFDKFSNLTDETANLIRELSQKGGGVKTNVTELEGSLICELRFHDPSGLLTTIKGAIYEMPDGNFGYVDYSTLDNSHFDADGNFSYRQGEVTVYPLKELAGRVDSALSNSYTIKRSFTYEYYEYEDDFDIIDDSDYIEKAALASFWIVFVLMGYLVPIAPLVIGLVFANSQKMSHPKRWYVVAGLAVLWMVLAVVLTVLLLV